jgi:uncharacterized membrane protein YgcG
VLLALLLSVVPAPPAAGHHFVDTSGKLSTKVRDEIDELAETVHTGDYGELAVAVLDACDDAQATGREIFDAWPVGHAEHYDGALLIICAAQPRAAIVLGDGFGRFAKAQSPQVIGKWIAPSLREGDIDTAAATGTRAMLDLLVRYHRPAHDDAVEVGTERDSSEQTPTLPSPEDPDLWHAFAVPTILGAPLLLMLLGGWLLLRRR